VVTACGVESNKSCCKRYLATFLLLLLRTTVLLILTAKTRQRLHLDLSSLQDTNRKSYLASRAHAAMTGSVPSIGIHVELGRQ